MRASWPKRPMLHSEPKAGFTLIEMLAVMSIIALVAGLTVTMGQGSGRSGLKAVVMHTAALIRHERRAAILTAHERRVSLDGVHRSFIGDDGDEVAIPKDIVVDVLGADAASPGRQMVVLFHPDGASSGSAIHFSRQGAAYEIRVNWLTGQVAVDVP
jgi:general secretion pathway protein H